MKLTFLQPSVMVAKGKISFATITHGCKTVIIDKIRSLLKIRINQWIWQTKGQFHFSFFKVDSQNWKFYLEYLVWDSVLRILAHPVVFRCLSYSTTLAEHAVHRLAVVGLPRAGTCLFSAVQSDDQLVSHPPKGWPHDQGLTNLGPWEKHPVYSSLI